MEFELVENGEVAELRDATGAKFQVKEARGVRGANLWIDIQTRILDIYNKDFKRIVRGQEW